MEEFLTIGQVAKLAMLPETTARRYASLFAGFMETRKFGRTQKYAPGVVELIRTIAAMYEAGKETVEINAILQGTVPQVIDAATESQETALMTARDARGVVALLEAQAKAIMALQREIEALRGQREDEQAALLGELHALREQVTTLQAQQAAPSGWWARLAWAVRGARKGADHETGSAAVQRE